LFIFQGSIFSVSAQGNTAIHGKVIDERTGETIIGASISSKGATINSGTVTDLDGVFDLKVSSLPATIVVSYIGYRTQEIDIYEAPKETVVIPLVEVLNALNEVVVVVNKPLTPDGFIILQYANTRTFDKERDYLFPIPLLQLSLNKNLTQNPKW
jgi:hypothetical protein